MAIANRNHKKGTASQPIPDEKKIDALINKGGSSSKAQAPAKDTGDDNTLKPMLLKLRGFHHDDIEEILKLLPIRERISSRHSYVIKAVEEQLKRDKKRLKLGK